MILEMLQRSGVYQFVLRVILPHLMLRIWGYPKYPMGLYFELREFMKREPEQVWVFVGVDRSALSFKLHRLLTKCEWNHTGFAMLVGGEIQIRHMVATGYRVQPLLDYLREVDDFCAIPLGVTQDVMLPRIQRLADSCAGFDFNFSLNESKYLFCSEFVYRVCRQLFQEFKSHWMRSVFGKREIFEPDDVYESALVLSKCNCFRWKGADTFYKQI